MRVLALADLKTGISAKLPRRRDCSMIPFRKLFRMEMVGFGSAPTAVFSKCENRNWPRRLKFQMRASAQFIMVEQKDCQVCKPITVSRRAQFAAKMDAFGFLLAAHWPS